MHRPMHMTLTKNEQVILDVIRRMRNNPGDGVPLQAFYSIAPAADRDAAMDSLVEKGILNQRNGRLFVTPDGETYI